MAWKTPKKEVTLSSLVKRASSSRKTAVCRSRSYSVNGITRIRHGYGADWFDTVKAVHERDGWACVICNAKVNLHTDHIRRESRGGSRTGANLRTLCEPCHMARHAHMTPKKPKR